MNPGYSLVALNWQPVGDGSVTEIGINELFSAEDSANFTAQRRNQSSNADQILVWAYDGSMWGFKTYFYCSNPATGTGNAWCDVTDSTRTPTTDTIDLAQGFWFYKQGSESLDVTMKGQVSAVSSYPLTFTAATSGESGAYTLFGSAFPAGLSLNDESLDWTGAIAQRRNQSSNADQILVWAYDGSMWGFKTYFYCSNPATGTGNAWCDVTDSTRTPTTEPIPSGSAAWYLRKGTTPLTISLPRP